MAEHRIDLDTLGRRVRAAMARLARCELCPWRCGADRRAGPAGRCASGRLAAVASVNLHRGEEPPLSGSRGSGTVFFSGCNLRCRFCQNWPISRGRVGTVMGPVRLGRGMLDLEARGAHNINLVTGSHLVPQFLAAAWVARRGGLRIPFVWNSSGYDGPQALALLDGVVDVYLPDLKYADDAAALACSGAPDYWAHATAAIREMSRQVGRLTLDDDGIARSGLIIRHLVLLGGLAGTRRVLAWIAEHLPYGTAVSLMGQYFPAAEALDDRVLGRRLTDEEYAEACGLLDEFPEIRGWTQDMSRPGGC